MCAPSIPPPGAPRLLGEILSALPSSTDLVPLVRERGRADARSGGRDARTECAYADARVRADWSWAAVEDRLDLIALGSTRAIGWADRRAGQRVESLVLPFVHRESARQLQESSRSCGNGVRAFQRKVATSTGHAIERLIRRTACKTRACGPCQARIRELARDRMAFDAKTFLTLTIPPDMHGVLGSWELFHEVTRSFLAIIRREEKYRHVEITGKRRGDRTRRRNRRRLARRRLQGAGSLEYAWAAEPQKTGMPHLHMLLSYGWVDKGWIGDTWAALWGALDCVRDVRKVKSVGGACWYLTVYVAKQRTTLDILSIVKSRRMWATTKPRAAIDRVKWMPESGKCEAVLLSQVDKREGWAAERGWKVESGADECYAMFSRKAMQGEEVFCGQTWQQYSEKVNFEDIQTTNYLDVRNEQSVISRIMKMTLASAGWGEILSGLVTNGLDACYNRVHAIRRGTDGGC